MHIFRIKSNGLAHQSYLIASGKEAIVIDPRRDCKIYADIASREEVEIQHILETHRNEDYVIGSLELKNKIPSARIGHSSSTKFEYGDDSLDDEENLKFGNVRVTCLKTPGHTDDSMCYVLADLQVSEDPLVIFTGDTLFVNEVGRTDLVDIKKTEKMARKLHASLHEKVLPLGDGVIVYPGHGAGSVCGGAIGNRDFSTIGYERKNNIWLDMDEDDFTEAKKNQKLTRVPYFKRCERLNTIGPPLLSEAPTVKMFTTSRIEEILEEDSMIVVDTRESELFIHSHLPNSISLSLSSIGLIAGWVLDSEQKYAFVLDTHSQLDEAVASLYRIGIDSVEGYLGIGFHGWKDHDKITQSLKMYELDEIKSGITNETIQLVDVRQPHETEIEHVENSVFVPLTTIQEDMSKISKEKPVATICPSGVRSTTGASILKHNGFEDVGVLIDGLKEWKKRGYPTTSSSDTE